MSRPCRALVAALLLVSACATGDGGGSVEDAAGGGAVDAAEPDGPEPDAAGGGEIDAPAIDAAAIDAAAIDAATIDAAAIDAATIDAAAIDAAAIDAAAIDAAAIDAPAVDAGIDAPPGPVDTCAQALDLTAAATGASGVTVSGSTIGYANNVQVPTACTGYSTLAPDAIYTVALAAGQMLTAVATPSTSWDISVYVTSTCSTTATCMVGDDSSLGGVAENVAFTATAAGTYYIVVDGWSANTVGAYALNVRVQ